MSWLVNIAYLLAGIAYLPVALHNALILGKNRRGWRQRFGAVPKLDPSRKRIWIHAVSLGEINATPKLVEHLRRRLPDYDIVFSTTTDTGFARAVKLYGAGRVFRFPLDFGSVVRRVLDRISPSLIVLVELEVWYNLTRLATRRGVAVAVVNGRLTERSARRLGWLGGAVRSMFGDLAWVGAQDEAIAERFGRLGVAIDRIEITSSLKWDSAEVADAVDGADALASALGIDSKRPVWVCGSTGPKEESRLLSIYRDLIDRAAQTARDVLDDPSSGGDSPVPVLVLVPRKPERFDEVAALIQRMGFDCVRRSACADGGVAHPIGERVIVLGDTMGELRKFYSLADVVFVGRSLVAMGGSDPMEVAALGKPIVVGPHMENFAGPVSAMRDADAIRQVGDDAALAAAVSQLLADPESARLMGTRARQVVFDHQGATKRTAARLVELLQEATSQ